MNRSAARSFRGRALLILILGLVYATAVYAHLQVMKTSPKRHATLNQAPESIQIRFSQVPDLVLSKLELEGPDGEVALGKLTSSDEKGLRAPVAGPMPDGDYTAHWQTAGEDGHVQKGQWKFTVRSAASGADRDRP